MLKNHTKNSWTSTETDNKQLIESIVWAVVGKEICGFQDNPTDQARSCQNWRGGAMVVLEAQLGLRGASGRGR